MRRVLLIQTRNLGDAIIGTSLLETLRHGMPEAQIDVLTPPEQKMIFAHNPHVNTIHTARFPMGSSRVFGQRELLQMAGVIWLLRRQKYTDVVNQVGDFREDLLARVLSRGGSWSPGWPANHPQRNEIRISPFRLVTHQVAIEPQQLSMYHVVWTLGRALSGAEARKPALYEDSGQQIVWNPDAATVALNPMASQPWKMWASDRWRALALSLVDLGMKVHVFGSRGDAAYLQDCFGTLQGENFCIETGSIAEYFRAMAKMRVAVCLDSLSAHVAYAVGTPIVFLNGANDPRVWSPPGSLILSNGAAMPCHPCHNNPICIGQRGEFGCILGISPSQVLNALISRMTGSSAPCTAL